MFDGTQTVSTRSSCLSATAALPCATCRSCRTKPWARLSAALMTSTCSVVNLNLGMPAAAAMVYASTTQLLASAASVHAATLERNCCHLSNGLCSSARARLTLAAAGKCPLLGLQQQMHHVEQRGRQSRQEGQFQPRWNWQPNRAAARQHPQPACLHNSCSRLHLQSYMTEYEQAR